MRLIRIASVCALLAVITACDSGSTGSAVIRPDAMVRMIGADMDVESDVGSTDVSDGTVTDAGPAQDQGGPVIDDAGLPVVDTCEQICALYQTCDRLDIWPGRSIASCMEACEDVSDLDNFSRYQLCLQTTSCDRLQECRLPQRPRATCPQVCEALNACGADIRLPGGLPNISDCEDACNTPSIAADVRQCGEAYVADAEACDEETFALCLLREQAEDCALICERRAECSGLEDVVGCALECANRPEPEDPIVRRRARFAVTCAERAVTCEEYLECSEQSIAGVDPDDVAALCDADAECGFLGMDCPPRAEGLLLATAAGAGECLGDHFRDHCEASPLPCITPETPALAACDEFCAVSSLCGQLPDGLLELECTEQCRAAVSSGRLNALAPFRVGLRCAYAASCADFSECVEEGGRGDVSCADHCQARVECQAADGPACEVDCEARAGTLRSWAERTCNAAAGTCEAAAQCVAPNPPPCDALCALRDACGQADETCIANCDDADYVDSEWFVSRYACLVSTDNCGARAVCDTGQEAGGYACLNWCRNELECADQEGDLLECLTACGAGIPGRDGLVFESAYDCLRDAGEGAECEPIAACIAAAQPQELCVEFCAEQERCGLVEDAADCEAACRNDVESEDAINQLQCVLSAVRRQAGCAPIAECVGIEVDPASDLCRTFCAEQAECDPDLDGFLCERECTPEPDGLAVRNVCLGYAECPQYPVCVQADGTVPMECMAACETVSMCPGLIGEAAQALYVNAEACHTDCAARAILADAEFTGNLQECLGEVMCDAEGVTGCFEGRMPIDCGSGWDAIVACNNQALLAISGINDRAGYVMTCEQQFQMDPQQTEMQLACLIDVAAMANGDPIACFGQIACVLGGLGP